MARVSGRVNFWRKTSEHSSALEPFAGPRLVARSALGALSTHFFAVLSQDLEELVPRKRARQETQPSRVRLRFENRHRHLDGIELPEILLNASPQRPPRMPNQRKSSYDVVMIHQ